MTSLARFYEEAAARLGTDPAEIKRCVEPESLDDISSCYLPFTTRRFSEREALAEEMGVLPEDVYGDTVAAYFEEREEQYRQNCELLGIEPEEPRPSPRRYESREIAEMRQSVEDADALYEQNARLLGFEPEPRVPMAVGSYEDRLFQVMQARGFV